MALSFNTVSKTGIPPGTIRTTWDKYMEPGFRGNLSERFNRANLNGQCLGSIFPNNMSSGKVPIGAWVRVHDGSCVNNSISDSFIYGSGVHSGSSFPQRLTDDVALNCAGGSALSYNEYPSATTDKCFIGTSSLRKQNVDNNTQGGVHYPVFCQLGDYVETVFDCKLQCASNDVANLDPANDNYCHFAKERLCGKLTGEPLKKNADATEAILSDRDWIREPICGTFCGGPGAITSKKCYENKHKYCKDPRGWNEASEKGAKFITSSILPDFPIYSNVDKSLTSSSTGTQLIINRNRVSVGDRILVKDQVIKQQNGIYRVENDGSSLDSDWKIVRTSDFNQASTPLAAGAFVVINEQDSSVWGLESSVFQINPLRDEVVFIPTSRYDPGKASYCKAFWKDQLNKKENNESDIDSDIIGDIDDTCEVVLLDTEHQNNIRSSLGCGSLCIPKDDVNGEYCKNKSLAFCSVRDPDTGEMPNMETNYCYNVCSATPGLCTQFLENTYCPEKKLEDNGISLDNDSISNILRWVFKQTGSNTNRIYADYCGCMLPSGAYGEYLEFLGQKLSLDNPDLTVSAFDLASLGQEPQCIFPPCKSFGIKKLSQNTEDCKEPECLQAISLNFENAVLNNAPINIEQNGDCASIISGTTTPGSSEPPEPPEPEDKKNGLRDLELGLIVTIGVLVLIGFIIGIYVWYNKYRKGKILRFLYKLRKRCIPKK